MDAEVRRLECHPAIAESVLARGVADVADDCGGFEPHLPSAGPGPGAPLQDFDVHEEPLVETAKLLDGGPWEQPRRSHRPVDRLGVIPLPRALEIATGQDRARQPAPPAQRVDQGDRDARKRVHRVLRRAVWSKQPGHDEGGARAHRRRGHEGGDGTGFGPGVGVEGEEPRGVRPGQEQVDSPGETEVLVTSHDVGLGYVVTYGFGRAIGRGVVVDEDVEVDSLVGVEKVAKSTHG